MIGDGLCLFFCRGNVSSILVLEPVLLMEVAERILRLPIVVRLEVECLLEAVA